ncbi:hypothetical protein DFJ77DRAFT_551273 [Powellomyces hirtus]|nr:hypothetical protein DFJ77DRAFT_551273 [Powellomyces hirtus]
MDHAINRAMPGNSSSNRYLVLAILAGSLGSLASVFSKLAASPTGALGGNPLLIHPYRLTIRSILKLGAYGISPQILRATCILLTVLANVLMWITFTKSLNHAPSSAHVTTASNAANVVVAAGCGYLLFGDQAVMAPQWWVGIACVLAGAALIGRGLQEGMRHEKKTS